MFTYFDYYNDEEGFIYKLHQIGFFDPKAYIKFLIYLSQNKNTERYIDANRILTLNIISSLTPEDCWKVRDIDYKRFNHVYEIFQRLLETLYLDGIFKLYDYIKNLADSYEDTFLLEVYNQMVKDGEISPED